MPNTHDKPMSRLTRLHLLFSGTILRKMPRSVSAFFLNNKGSSSLANRILLLQLVWAIFIYALVIATLWFATNLVVESSVRHQGQSWITKLDELGIPIYATNDPDQLKEAIRYLQNFPEVAQAQYLDETGTKVIAKYTRENILVDNFAPLSVEAIQELARTDMEHKKLLSINGENSQMRFSSPIWIKSIANDGMIDYSVNKESGEKVETIGFIDIVLDYSKITSELNRNIFYASLFIALMMIVAAFIARLMVRWALLPLSELEDPLTRLAEGETDVIVKSSGDKEIARIGIALNTTISALKERDEALRHIANHDSLTGLVNRKYFIERLEQELGRIARGGSSAALLFFDLDRFKYINDTYGHASGDRLLIQIANLLSRRMRDYDLAARFGGDEFTLLAYGVDLKSAQEIAESFISSMNEFTFHESGDALKIYFSIGITIIDDGSLTPHDYLKEADVAVRQSKARGRNCHSSFVRSKQSNIDEKSDTGWHKRFQEVLVKHQAILHYQPNFALKEQRELYYEVLLRLPGDDQQVITPGAFMPAAERFGLMSEFDSEVIRKAALVLAEQNDPQVMFFVNLSEQFLARGDIAEFLEEVINVHDIAANQLIFDLPERYVVRNIAKLKVTLAKLVKRGYRFAIDDFGAGFGSFKYIKSFPVNFLKIDGELIEHITDGSISRATVRAIVEVAVELNMQTVAKNVSDEASVTLLRELGVDFAQGNYIAAPSPQLKNNDRKAKHAF